MSEDSDSFLPVYDREIPSSTDNDSSSRTDSSLSSRSSSPSPNLPAPADDINIKINPDRHVDYLSHEWTENDIWVSWRQVTKQKAFLQSGARLENASWRIWAKSRNNLKTISPETLNWLKDCDVTWLYGPLHRGTKFDSFSTHSSSDDTLTTRQVKEERLVKSGSAEWPMTKPRLESHSSSYVVPSRRSNKPILKKRSNSEMMLARHNLVVSEYSPVSVETPEEVEASNPATKAKPARPIVVRTHSANSALRSARKQHFRKETGGELNKRRIHFNESVEQCISLIKPDPEDDGYDSSSSDDAPTMRISAPKPPINIAKLPSTTLKLPSGTPDGLVGHYGSTIPIFAEDDDSEDDMIHGKYATHIPHAGNPSAVRTSRSNSTESAILPNYDGLQDISPPPGIFGRAAEVVSSARDLVSVIWSASGWKSRSDDT